MIGLPMIHNGAEYRAADAHAHIYPEKIAEKATASVGAFYDLNMDNVGLPSVLLEQGGGAGIDRFAVCSVATKVEQVRSINSFIEGECKRHPEFVGLGAWHQDIEGAWCFMPSIPAPRSRRISKFTRLIYIVSSRTDRST